MADYTGAADGAEDEEENQSSQPEKEVTPLPKKKPQQEDVSAQAVGSLRDIMQKQISGEK